MHALFGLGCERSANVTSLEGGLITLNVLFDPLERKGSPSTLDAF